MRSNNVYGGGKKSRKLKIKKSKVDIIKDVRNPFKLKKEEKVIKS